MLRCIVDHPGDENLRSRFAAKIHARDPERAKFIRCQIELAEAPDPLDSALIRMMLESRKLAQTHYCNWSGFNALPLPKDISWEFRKGFVEHVRTSGTSFLKFGDALAKSAPLRHVTFTRLDVSLKDLSDRSPVGRMRTLSFDHSSLGSEFAREFTGRSWPDLVWLSLAHNSLDREDVIEFARASLEGRMPRLQFLDLTGGPFDPRENLTWDQGILVDARLPESGRQLIEELGGMPSWFRLTGIDGEPVEHNRFRVAERQESLGQVAPANAGA